MVLISKGINNLLIAFFFEPILSLSAKVVLFEKSAGEDVKLLGFPQLVFFPIGCFLPLGTWAWQCSAGGFLFGHMRGVMNV
jgi:hypothetical protein